ncbi:hypothetical protein M9435_006831 [Picochlorum sp. BPE23]|nr:hypothetical protein M9435_006831 [Picochlorum sp. BPE23]
MKSHTESRRFALDSIQHENDHLKALLFDICDAPSRGPHGNQHSALVALEVQDRNLENRLQQLRDDIQREINRFHTVQRTLEDRRAEAGCPDALYLETVLAEKRVRRLEDQKYQSNITKGEAELQCRSLRTSIDGLRKERILFDELQHKRKHELFCIAQEMASLVPNILSRIESKDQMKRSLEKIRRQSVKDKEEWYTSWRDQVLQMERFQSTEIAHQEKESNERRAKLHIFMNLDPVSEQRSLQSRVGMTGSEHSTVTGDDVQCHSDMDDIDAVSTQIAACTGPKTPHNLVRAFETLRNACAQMERTISNRNKWSGMPM